MRVSLRYDKGTIIVDGMVHVPYTVFDPKINRYRALAMHYPAIVEYLKASRIDYEDHVLDLIPIKKVSSRLLLRDYQSRALRRWLDSGMKGCIVLPTGSGKTMIGIKAIESVSLASLVVVPTLDLVEQWVSSLADAFSISREEIGVIGGGEDRLKAITVITYDSAYIRAPSIGNRFALLVFDEVHHLPAQGYRSIAELMAAPYRLGLTATVEREDGLHQDIPMLLGAGVVFSVSAGELAEKRYLARFTIERRYVRLTEEEMDEYRRNYELYMNCLDALGIEHGLNGFRRLIMLSNRNRMAREALLARNKALSIALNSSAKIEELREILAEYNGAKMIIFTQHNDQAYRVSREFLIPLITHNTGKDERTDILRGFRDGTYRAIVTSKVLDEGIDVPDAELGVILSGTGSSREFVQRLGRLLRPKDGKSALLIEIVSRETREMLMSSKRKRSVRVRKG
ncbi:MAG: DEAD/DEAH box helicase family protein [Candidatus Nitrosocaldus sp.]|nr:DEAD/DEAH box helicase family protein [Candidatus Nitrosocaldus sp.]MDW8000965.1 DEAD/DEAH box helicase family protein [Candidatus Nitrosocaldus sp.]MDW8275909.1 DEAD/DEAH box helicase family protein [Candidatus Nitrosocaldus sp.]